MHKYLRAIGFSALESRTQVQEVITDIVNTATERKYTNNGDNRVFTEYTKEFGDDIGITVVGDFEQDNTFIYSHYFPFLKGTEISSLEDISIERHAEKESYAGVCDDIKVGVSLIFYLQNVIDYLKVKNRKMLPMAGTSLVLSALSTQGLVMMPIIKNEKELEKVKQVSSNRNILMEAARKGDEDAIESLTLEDMDMYTTISKKIHQEDVFTLVDTYFMPYGVECDQYSVLGEIKECELVKNKLTQEEVWKMIIVCNELSFALCINKEDLLGEPDKGRRFKGNIWLQGRIIYPEI